MPQDFYLNLLFSTSFSIVSIAFFFFKLRCCLRWSLLIYKFLEFSLFYKSYFTLRSYIYDKKRSLLKEEITERSL